MRYILTDKDKTVLLIRRIIIVVYIFKAVDRNLNRFYNGPIYKP
jgi:hypothetical protein